MTCDTNYRTEVDSERHATARVAPGSAALGLARIALHVLGSSVASVHAFR